MTSLGLVLLLELGLGGTSSSALAADAALASARATTTHATTTTIASAGTQLSLARARATATRTSQVLGTVEAPSLSSPKVAAHCDLGLPTHADVKNPNDFLFARNGYVGSYNAARKEPNWIQYKVTPKMYGDKNNWIPRAGGFRTDHDLPEGMPQARVADYHKSGYDMGHEKRSGDAPLQPGSELKNHATFVLSNVVPQAPNVNRGPWNHFEDYYRDLAMNDHKDVRVIVGNLFEGKTKTIGESDVGVPSHLFKIIAISNPGTHVDDMSPANTKLMAVLMPNDNEAVRDTDNFAKYIVAPSDLIKRSGWSGMLSNLPPAVRAQLVDTKPTVERLHGAYKVDGEYIKNPLPAAVRRMQERDEQMQREKAREAQAPTVTPAS